MSTREFKGRGVKSQRMPTLRITEEEDPANATEME